jgi:Ca2+-binding RTX toxin-like protein
MFNFWYNWKSGTHKDDTINGGRKSDVIYGFGGNDKLYGNGGNDVLVGGKGDDSLWGGAGNDRLYGGEGNDNLWGGMGHDAIFGGMGNDTIEGGRGNDVLKGGEGADRFIFNPNQKGEGHDRIKDFELGTDKIVLSVANVLASTPGLLALSGDPKAFEGTDLDASNKWNLSASHDGDLVISHPTGAIELDGIKFAESLNFTALLPAIDLIA